MSTMYARTRKPLTAAQQQASDEKRASMRALTQRISKLSDAERMQLAMTCSHIVTCEHRTLSMHNACMLAFQKPDATVIGGFQQWKRLGRMVRKGEKALYIWIPLGQKTTDEHGNTSTLMADEKRFTLVPMFDVSQTDDQE